MNITRCPEEFGCYRYKLQIEGICLSGKDDRGQVVFVMFNRRQPVRSATSKPEAKQDNVASNSRRTRATEL